MAIPLIDRDDRLNQESGVLGRFEPSTLIWSDEFNGPTLDGSRWIHNTMSRDRNGQNFARFLSQSGVAGHDNDGNVILNGDGSPRFSAKPEGKRWALWYNRHLAETLRFENGKLVLAGKLSSEIDPTIDAQRNIPGKSYKAHPYFDPRASVNRQVDLRYKIYGPWIQGAMAIEDIDNQNAKIIDPQSPRQIFRYGFYEYTLNNEAQQYANAYRTSAWLMPMCLTTSPDVYHLVNGSAPTYNGNAASGAEIDLHERENGSSGTDQLLLMKVLDGTDSSFGPGLQATRATDYGFDLNRGTHVIGLWWSPTGLRWYLNGRQVNVDLRRIPKIGQAFFFTREANTGVHGGRPVEPELPYRQDDPGLYNDSVGRDPSSLNSDKVLVDYLRIWQDPTLNGDAANDDTNWRHDATYEKIDPATPGGNESSGDARPGRFGGSGGEASGERYHVPATRPTLTTSATDRVFQSQTYVEASVEGAGQVECRVDIIDNPFDQPVTYSWEHDFPPELGARFNNPSAPATSLFVPEGVEESLTEVRCRLTLGPPARGEPTAQLVSISGDYVIR